jgi:hypothetical protein
MQEISSQEEEEEEVGEEDEEEDEEEGSLSGSQSVDFGCTGCGEAGDGEELLLCDGCEEGCGPAAGPWAARASCCAWAVKGWGGAGGPLACAAARAAWAAELGVALGRTCGGWRAPQVPPGLHAPTPARGAGWRVVLPQLRQQAAGRSAGRRGGGEGGDAGLGGRE